MKERPIIFTGESVRAILDGRKTQTRRVVKPQPKWVADPHVPFKTSDADPKGIIDCSYGKVGDRIWVRETWGYFGGDEYLYQRAIESVGYKATHMELDPIPGEKWRSPVFMPRWASRLTLEIVGVRVQRLQNISEEDAEAECVEAINISPMEHAAIIGNHNLPQQVRELVQALGAGTFTARGQFWALWDSINGKRAGCSWADNPWVWAIEFRRVYP